MPLAVVNLPFKLTCFRIPTERNARACLGGCFRRRAIATGSPCLDIARHLQGWVLDGTEKRRQAVAGIYLRPD